MAASLRHCLSVILAASLAASPIVPRPRAELTRADYEACQARDETAFRTAIADITLKALRAEIEHIDYPSVVAREWRRLDLDKLIDEQVDVAVGSVRDETSWGNLIRSLANQEKAQELATAVAERVYQSDAMRAAVESLATSVGQTVGDRIEFASRDAAEPSLTCLNAFLGTRYGSSVAQAVVTDAGAEFGVDATAAGPGIGTGAILKESSAGITGAAILIMRRQLANMARRVGQRLAGSVLSRLVSVVAGGVGLVLIAKDVWDLRHGVLPIIAEEMKAETTKEKVRDEIAKSISEHIDRHINDIATSSADHIIGIWRNFRRAHGKVIALADRHDSFRAFLESVEAKQLPRLDEVVSIVLAAEGENGILRRQGDGTLDQAVKVLPDAAMTIARELRSVEAALKWNAVAGDKLPAVVDYGFYRRTTPATFTRASLTRLLVLDDRLAIARLAGQPHEAREVLLELGPDKLRALSRALTETEMSTLSNYLTGLKKQPRDQILTTVADNPARLQILKPSGVREAVIASADQAAAVEMLLRETNALNVQQIKDDVGLVWNGRIKARLLWAKHPIAIAAAAGMLLIVVFLFRRLLLPRGRTVTKASSS